jgi:hypothetical protein
MTDFLACPNCGEPCSDGELCNLTCRRELFQPEPSKRDERRARIQMLLRRLIVVDHQASEQTQPHTSGNVFAQNQLAEPLMGESSARTMGTLYSEQTSPLQG